MIPFAHLSFHFKPFDNRLKPFDTADVVADVVADDLDTTKSHSKFRTRKEINNGIQVTQISYLK